MRRLFLVAVLAGLLALAAAGPALPVTACEPEGPPGEPNALWVGGFLVFAGVQLNEPAADGLEGALGAC